MNRNLKRGIVFSGLLTVVINMSACGYFLYPERKGQSGGRVDPAVLILDGAALLFGIIPGIVAFAVDITNGTIYLPPGSSSVIDRHVSSLDGGEVRQVIDEEGQAWLEMPIETFTSQEKTLQSLGKTLSDVTESQIDASDIVWLEDSAALRAATATQTASR
ncbi:hypothetical protein [Microbulbifer variabilis]|jgi:hypothetical protein|uniref:Uncharacterized protein n=1 Tax=Microbulbifer variabilis TaxID=266805 RepID=A0ABY4VG80_9GAMM|nr:hypothetical protein [Microbulbifer variabilis]USD23000.1 hypothetical protein MJO52_07680 [Microbulbifer variabilis]